MENEFYEFFTRISPEQNIQRNWSYKIQVFKIAAKAEKDKTQKQSIDSPLIDGIFSVMHAVQFNARSACDASMFTSCIYILYVYIYIYILYIYIYI